MAEFDFDFGGYDVPSPGGLGQDISTYIPPSGPGFGGSADPMMTSVGPASSFGPFGQMGGGGGGDWLNTLSGYAKTAIPFLGLGTQALGAYTGVKGMQAAGQQQKFLTDAQRAAAQVGAPAAAAAGQLIPAGTQALMGGALPPQLEATVQNFLNAEKAKMRQQMAHMGITDSQAIVQAEAQIDAQAQQLRAQLAQGLLSGGQGIAGTGINAAQVGGGLAQREGDSITQALTAANSAVERLLGMAG